MARVDNPASNLNRNNSRSLRMDGLSAAISTSLKGGRIDQLLPSNVDAPPGSSAVPRAPVKKVLGMPGTGAHLARNACSASPERVLTLARNQCSRSPGARNSVQPGNGEHLRVGGFQGGEPLGLGLGHSQY